MTGRAVNAAEQVALVVEQHMLRHVEHLDPRRGGVRVVVGMLLENLGVIGDDVVVAVKAFFHRWYPRVVGALHIGVAEPTGDGLVTGMQAVAEGDRLLGTDAGARRRVVEVEKAQHQENAASDPQQRPAVGPDASQAFPEGRKEP